jgi:hypothetical protein
MKISGIYTKVREILRGKNRRSKQITAESIQNQIPFYLTQDAKESLASALNDFPRAIDYYINKYPENVLQGDGWNSFVVFDHRSGSQKLVKGILLTNSCDVAPENPREFPPTFTFAPIIKLNNYVKMLLAADITQQKINDKLNAIKEQKITTIFYLPKGAKLEEDYIALLSDVHTVPKEVFEAREDRQKLFTLSQVGFYLFILKLSLHFCRFHEGIERNPV